MRAPIGYRRRILAVGLIAAGALYSFGAPLYVNRIEDDLEQRVPEELADAGFTGVTAEFDGQDGTLTCAQPLDDPEQATDEAYGVWGVHAITLDRSCRVNRAPETGDSETSSAGEATVEQSNVCAGRRRPASTGRSCIRRSVICSTPIPGCRTCRCC